MAQNLTVKPAHLNKVQVMIDGVLTLLTNNLTQAQLLAIWQKPEYNSYIAIEYVNVQDSFPENFPIDPNLFNAYDSGQITHDKTKTNYPANTTGAALNEARGILDATNNSFVRSAFRPALLLDFVNSRFLDPKNIFTRNSVGSYIDEQGQYRLANINKPRFTHLLDTQSNGLLIESSRTNIYPNSEDLANAKSANVSFDGYTTLSGFRAFKFTLTAATNAYVSRTIPISSNTTYTYSYLCSIPNTSYVKLLNSASVTTRLINTTSELCAIGVYKHTATFTTTSDEVNGLFVCAVLDTLGLSFTVAAVQLEVSAFATSYIATTSSTPITRGLEKLSIPLRVSPKEFTLLINLEILNCYNDSFIELRGPDTTGWNSVRIVMTDIVGRFAMLMERDGQTIYNVVNFSTKLKKGILIYRVSQTKQTLYYNGEVICNNVVNITIPSNLSAINVSTNSSGVYLVKKLVFWNVAIPELDCLTLSAGSDKVIESDLGRSAFIRPEAILRTLGRQEFSIDGTGASITRNIRRPYDFYFELVDTTGYTALPSQPPVTLCSANTDYPLTVTLPVGKTLTYAIVPAFDN